MTRVGGAIVSVLVQGAVRPARHARVFSIVLLSQWLAMRSTADFVSTFFNGVPRFAILAWIAAQSDDSTVVATVSVGVVLLVVWTASVFRVGFALRTEAVIGTLDLNLLSRSPLVLITMGKAAAVVLSFVPNALVALLVVLVVTREPIAIAMLPAFAVAMALAAVSLLSVAFIFVPAMFLAGGRPGSFNAITPFGAVLSGFVYPLDVLPGWLEVVARLLPTSWAMESVRWAIFGGHDATDFLGQWAVAAGLTAVWAGLAVWLFGVAQHRLRRTGQFEGGF